MTALTKVEKLSPATSHFDERQIELIKNSICKNASDDELQFFIMACKRSGLDPFARQIYSVPRGGQRTIQTSVDGFRLIADRTGKYAPGREPTYEYDQHGNLMSATSYVKKQTRDGTWHEVSANASYSEYNAGSPLWKKMPKAMLSKCAECLALRKAFPAEMSGIYGQEEMDQADVKPESYSNVKPLYIQPFPVDPISEDEAKELQELYNGCSDMAKKGFDKKLEACGGSFNLLPKTEYFGFKTLLVERYKHNQSKALEIEMANRVEE